jgi:propionyl-CoA carboxylase alpha chain
VRHNIPFLSALMQHKRFQAGRLSTAFIAEEYPGGFRALAPTGDTAQVLAAVAAAIDHALSERRRRISGQATQRKAAPESRRVVRLGDLELALDIAREGEGLAIRFGGGRGKHLLIKSGWKPGEALWTGTVGGRHVSVQVRPVLNGFDLAHGGVETRARIYSDGEAAAARRMPAKTLADRGKTLRSPMPGLVMAVAVVEGQEVKAGETLAIVEAMKMENVLRAERDGTVKSIKVKAGDSLAVDQVILEFA